MPRAQRILFRAKVWFGVERIEEAEEIMGKPDPSTITSYPGVG